MKKIAITGGIGSGKSLVLKILQDEGYAVFSCDEIYREIILEKSYIEKISLCFPEVIENDAINKKKLADIVFKSKEKRELLDSIAHPFIMQRLNEKMASVSAKFVFAEVPLLFEGGYCNNFDEIIVVYRPLEERIQSIVLRDNITEQEVLNRINAQFNYHTKEGEDFIQKIGASILHNNGDIDFLKQQVNILLNNFS